MSATPEGKRSENHAMWRNKPSDNNNNNAGSSRTQPDGSWISPSHLSVSQHLFQDTTEDNKSVSTWSVISGYPTPPSTKLKNDSALETMDKVKKPEAPTSYRLFGIDLINHPNSSPRVQKESVQPVSASSGSSEAHVQSTISAADQEQKSDLSKEKKPELSQVSAKDIQSWQSGSASTRSRTKVLKTLSFVSSITIVVEHFCFR